MTSNLLSLPEPARTHASRLTERAASNGKAVEDPVSQAAITYLALRVDEPTVTPDQVASSRSVGVVELLRVMPVFRAATQFRAYVGEWIRAGRLLPPSAAPIADPQPPVVVAAAPKSVPQVLAKPPRRKFTTRVREAFRSPPRPRSGGSWTGTPGLHSYYDKDSSPD